MKRERQSTRLKGYDYSQAGAYFVTICTKDQVCLFGEVANGEMRLNAFGEIVQDEWFRSADIRREIQLHPEELVVMPNHIHGIVWIANSVGATGRSPLRSRRALLILDTVSLPQGAVWTPVVASSASTRP